MKRKIAIICCLVLVAMSLITVFAACNNDNLTDDDLMSLRSNLYYQYKDDPAEQTKNYKVVGEITGFDADRNEIKCAVVWTIDGPSSVTVSSDKDENGYYTINLPVQATLADSISYTLTGTLVNAKGEAYTGYKGDENAVYSVSFNRTLTKLGGDNVLLNHYLPDVISKPAMDTEYNLSMYNSSKNYLYYFTGALDGKYLATSQERSASVKVKLESADDGFYMYFMAGSTKTYLSFENDSGTGTTPKAKFVTSTTPSTVFHVDTNNSNILVASVDCGGSIGSNKFYIGSQPAYTTMSATSTYYIEGSKAANIDGSQCVARLIGDGDYNQYGGAEVVEPTGFTAITTPVAGTYKMAIWQATLGKMLYITSSMNGYYFASTEDVDKSADIELEASGDGWTMKIVGTDKYIRMYPRDGSTDEKPSSSLEFSATPCVWQWNSNLEAFYVTINGTNFYLGTYGTFNTFSGSAESYFTQSNPNFLAKLGTVA